MKLPKVENIPVVKFRRVTCFLLFLVCIGINIVLRIYPAYFPQLDEKARLNVEEELAQEVSGEIDNNYSDYNPLIKEKLFDELLKERKQNKTDSQSQVAEEYQELKDKYQNEKGFTYFLGLDSYQWFRYTKNVVKRGHPGDTLINGEPYDMHMLAPKGKEVVSNRLFFYISAFLYRVSQLLSPGLSLKKFAFYVPVFYVFIFLTLLYLFTRYIFSDIAAFLTTLFVGLTPMVFSRTCAGWFDYDSFTLIFPLAIVWSVGGALLAKRRKKTMLWALLGAVMLGLYAFSWLGYWWVFIVVVFGYLYVFLNNWSIKGKLDGENMTNLLAMGMFIFGSFVFVFLFKEANLFVDIFYEVQNRLGLGGAEGVSVWPDVYYTVAELQNTSTLKIINIFYGYFIFLFSILGMLFVYFKERRGVKVNYIIILLFWTFFMTYASMKGIRFTLFLSIPIGIFFGGTVQELSYEIRRRNKNFTKRKFLIYAIVFFGFCFWTGKKFIDSGIKSAISQKPIMNDKWHKALVYMKKNTPPESIINSWWDFGNFFKEVADRRVIFDGQSQNRPLAFWMANVLLTSSEEKAVRILRMLNNFSDSLFDEINDYIGNDFESMILLNKVLDSDLKQTKGFLNESKLPKDLKNKIIRSVYLNKPSPAYFVVDKSMLGKIRPISFLGNWSFPKAFVMKNRNRMSKTEILKKLQNTFMLSCEQAEKVYQEVIFSSSDAEKSEVLSERFRYMSKLGTGDKTGSIVYFDNGVVFDLSNMESRIFYPDGDNSKIKFMYFYDNEELVKKKMEDAEFKESGLFFEGEKGDSNIWKSVLLSKGLGDSLLTRLYFLKGKGLKNFELFYSDEEAGIYIYKIRWENETD